MRIFRGYAAAAILACTALGFAGPAQADQVMQGVYNYSDSEGVSGTWTIYPICVPTVGDLREPLALPVACRLHVLGSNGIGTGDAKLTGGLWAFEMLKTRAVTCPDGSSEDVTETFKFDDIALSGTRSIAHTGVCGSNPELINVPFTLSFKEPLATPVDRYPLICEPGGLRRCF